jgi:1,2-diacylglycerol 3-beta-galactosyltransferase
VGLPVAHRFCQPVGDSQELRKKLGWRQDLPTVLLVGGGEGMGPLEQVARAINQAKLPISLVIISGRNQKLKSNLESMDWNIPATIYGFVRQMPDFMRESDVLITKAGPGTISEAFIAGLPLILYSRLPGQEEGNVSYTVNEGAGVWAPTPEQVVSTLHNWLKNPDELKKTAANARRLARPQAAHQIAEILAAKVGIHSSQEQTLPT